MVSRISKRTRAGVYFGVCLSGVAMVSLSLLRLEKY